MQHERLSMEQNTNPLSFAMHHRAGNLDCLWIKDPQKTLRETNLNFFHISLTTAVIKIPSDGKIVEIMCSFKFLGYFTELINLLRCYSPLTFLTKVILAISIRFSPEGMRLDVKVRGRGWEGLFRNTRLAGSSPWFWRDQDVSWEKVGILATIAEPGIVLLAVQ